VELHDEMIYLQSVDKSLESCRNMINVVKSESYIYDFADKNCKMAHKRYARHYNLRSREERFQVGNQVIVLFPTDINKLVSKFVRLDIANDYAYLIEMPDGAVSDYMQINYGCLYPEYRRLTSYSTTNASSAICLRTRRQGTPLRRSTGTTLSISDICCQGYNSRSNN
jgi:hypothetical protein